MKRINLLKIFTASLMILLFSESPVSANGYELSDIHFSGTRWTSVAVSSTGRTFVCYPRNGFIPFSVAEIQNSTLIPYPDSGWNSWGAPMPVDSHFVCAQSLYIDEEDYLWVLDASTVNNSIISGGVKLVKIDLKFDNVTQIIYFDSNIAPQNSYLHDIKIDCQNHTAYITDSGLGAIIVVDVMTGQSRRVLENHYSVKAENIMLNVNGQNVSWDVHADGLALSKDRKFLYYKALTAYNLYRIPTQKLMDTTLTEIDLENEVDFVAVTIPCESMEFDSQNNLFLTSVQNNSIYYLTPDLNLELAIFDERLKWPDCITITQNDEIFLLTSRLFYQPGLHGLFKLEKSSASIQEINSNQNSLVLQNYPNPFQSSTIISFTVEFTGNVIVRISDITGKTIAVPVNETKSPGTYFFHFDAGNLPKGIYLCELVNAGKYAVNKMIIN